MKKNWLFILLILSGFCVGNAQNELSAYKYVIVPTKFEGFKRQNQYQTSTLIKYLLVERGINAVYDDALPSDLYNDRCLGVKAILVDESGTFTTKAHIAFQNCQLQEVFRTKTGTSKIKDYKGAFQEAIREALSSVDGYTYTYQPGDKETVTLSFENDVRNLEEEVKTESPEIVEETTKVESSQEALPVEDKTVVKTETEEQPEVPVSIQETVTAPAQEDLVWYAQEIANGYQLVDKRPQVMLRLYRTKQAGVFLAESDAHRGIVYQDGGTWYFDYYQDGNLVHKPLNIKF